LGFLVFIPTQSVTDTLTDSQTSRRLDDS